MTKDPPKGIKSNLLQLYQIQNSTKNDKLFFQSCSKQEEWQKLFMGLSYFHAIIRERRRFGPIGWNNQYDFNESDFKISMRQLHNMLCNYDQVPFKALNYLTGECYYGGRVTDEFDRRTLKNLLSDFYNESILYDENFQFSDSKNYIIPAGLDLDTGIEYI